VTGWPKTALQIFARGSDQRRRRRKSALIIAPGRHGRLSGKRPAAMPADCILSNRPAPRGLRSCPKPGVRFHGAKDPFLHLISDHLYISKKATRLCPAARGAARASRELRGSRRCRPRARAYVCLTYGTVGGRRIPRQSDVYEIENVIEKTDAERGGTEADRARICEPGITCAFFGIHVLTPTVMSMLRESLAQATARSLADVGCWRACAGRKRYLALEVQGMRPQPRPQIRLANGSNWRWRWTAPTVKTSSPV